MPEPFYICRPPALKCKNAVLNDTEAPNRYKKRGSTATSFFTDWEISGALGKFVDAEFIGPRLGLLAGDRLIYTLRKSKASMGLGRSQASTTVNNPLSAKPGCALDLSQNILRSQLVCGLLHGNS